jgi:hypothetical protein
MRRPWSIWARAMWWMHLLISVFVVLVKCDCGSGWRMPAPWCPPCGACEWASDGGPARAHRHRVPGRIPGRLVPHPAWPAAIAGARRASVRIGHTGAALPTRLVGSCWDQSQSEAGLAAAQAVLTNLGNQKDIQREPLGDVPMKRVPAGLKCGRIDLVRQQTIQLHTDAIGDGLDSADLLYRGIDRRGVLNRHEVD